MSDLRLDTVSFAYGGKSRETLILDRVSLSIASGQFVAVLGQSGSGKTSLLNLAAGFETPTAGTVSIDGRIASGPSADRAVVFQDDALFVWLNARDNVALPLQLKGIAAPERRRRADALLASVGLAGDGDKSIWTLSGGMRQRVGIARALAAEPKFLLMDEPLGALDAMTRERMQELLLQVWHTSRTGALLITHSVEEALFLATEIIVLAPQPGRIVLRTGVAFGARFLAGEPARRLRSEPGFILARETLLAAIHGEATAVAA
ncbi:MAG: Taurine import ATP-binding protein TauB [Devosia sp.]|nr:Taurine import ATP-binding protein TauB [Devosia sp.]